MKHLLAIFALLHATLITTHAEPVRLIFDTDMGNDVDDLMALIMIHNLQSRGACELLAVTITKDHPQAAAFTDAVNTFYGRPDIPIGVVRDGGAKEPGRFNLLAEEKSADGSLLYPHDLTSGTEAPEAVALLMKTLAAQPDHSVVIAQVGFFTNLGRLLDAPGGRELVAKKVKLLSVMAGMFQTVNHTTRHLEYNVRIDVPTAEKVAKQWPTPIVWSGFEIGWAATFPHEVIERDLDYLPHHPLKEAYIRYLPPPHDRPTWDPTAVLYAVLPDRGYFDLSPPGTVSIEPNGATNFNKSKSGKGLHRFLTMTPEQTARVREAVVQFCVAPPDTFKPTR
ncbi:MAG: nucleoside hydrolase [Prosthecobacter sp.]|jgi:inosine-uridine nucleoside N-ribohydrolase|uniref:nucleoside hydrolase n=1 Tax=Prosthecobacter sp. TaxID=1965333 RepID=UPI0019E7A32C|nr:nucleoside hydrolase [Prosthecobacter sp.]MBE2285035.1 nucleoside hydrolase [Prosthecobacter sp.]